MKNKIHKYDFLIVGAGLIGALAALALAHKKYKVLIIDKKNNISKDNRTLAVNANSIDFLKQLGIWKELKSKPQPIDKIFIKDNIYAKPLIFENDKESMGNVILNKEMYQVARQKLEKLKILKNDINLKLDGLLPNKKIFINNSNYMFKKIIISMGKSIIHNSVHKKALPSISNIILTLVFLNMIKIILIQLTNFLQIMDLWLFCLLPLYRIINQHSFILQSKT